jgi:glycosyltransferase involved in cell wall biosynthesis
MNYKPLVSIITATFNAENDLEACIKSVISQSYINLEFIIVDGGSTDGTLEIIKKYKNFISISISEKDKGIYDAWNKGLKLANGDWIAFLGADDLYMPDAIQNYINHLNTLDYSNLDIISSKIMLVNENDSKLRVIGKEWKWALFRRYMCTAHVGSLHSKSFFEKYGSYNINYKIVGDYEILLRAKDLLKAAFLNEITVNMKIGGVSNLDNRAVIEAMKAKIENKACGFWVAKYDSFKANFIFYVRKIIKKV